MHANSCDNISQFSVDSITSQESKEPVFIAAGDIRYVRAWLPSLLAALFFVGLSAPSPRGEVS